MTRYEQFNEMMFESYCKTSISNAVKKERKKKMARWQIEQPLSTLTDAMLFSLTTADNEGEQRKEPFHVFHIQNMSIPVYDLRLSTALSHLLPQDREIILLHFFRGLNDSAIAPLVHLSRRTVARRRAFAVKRLRELMEAPL